VSREIPAAFDHRLPDDALKQIRLKLDSAGVRLVTYDIPRIPGDPEECRKVFEFGRKIGIETFVSETPPEALDAAETSCDEYDIRLALHDSDPDRILKVCQGRGKRIGACADPADWMRSGIDPIKAVNALRDRLITVRMRGLDERSKVEPFLKEIHRRGLRPTLFGIEHAGRGPETMDELARCMEFFNRVSLSLAP
jgi:sugar phosphate isomerase/epimerase